MGITTKSVTVDSTRDQIVGTREASGGTIQNIDADDTVYIGGSDVTTANGFPLAPGQSTKFSLTARDTLHGVCASGKSAELRVFLS